MGDIVVNAICVWIGFSLGACCMILLYLAGENDEAGQPPRDEHETFIDLQLLDRKHDHSH